MLRCVLRSFLTATICISSAPAATVDDLILDDNESPFEIRVTEAGAAE